MGNVQSLLVLLIAAALLVRLAERAHVPSPIVLVLGGLAIAFTPGLPDVTLEPDAIFLIFLPPLVYAAGWQTSPRELRAIVRPLGVLSVALVFATAAAIALVAHALVDGMGWPAAAVLGAVLAPTDTVAATAVFARVGAPERLRLLVEGESMINDATALVLYRIAVKVAAGGTLTALGAVGQFALNVAGGVLAGVVVGWLSSRVIRRQGDAPLVIVGTLLTGYGAYIGAEELHVSGILAAVVAGLLTGWNASSDMDADTRLTGVAFWRVLTFALEIMLFVLLGLQLPEIVDQLEGGVGELLLPAAGVALVTLAVRMACVFAIGEDAGETASERLVLGWSGMRGAVSLAAALAVPLAVPERPMVVFLTFALILVTLVGQGLTLPLLLRLVDVPEERRWSDEEAAARMEAAQAALDRLDELEEEGVAGEQQLGRLREHYRRRFRVCMAVLGGELPHDGVRSEALLRYGELRRDLIGIERGTLIEMRDRGRVRNQTVRAIERDLDLEEARLRV